MTLSGICINAKISFGNDYNIFNYFIIILLWLSCIEEIMQVSFCSVYEDLPTDCSPMPPPPSFAMKLMNYLHFLFLDFGKSSQ